MPSQKANSLTRKSNKHVATFGMPFAGQAVALGKWVNELGKCEADYTRIGHVVTRGTMRVDNEGRAWR